MAGGFSIPVQTLPESGVKEVEIFHHRTAPTVLRSSFPIESKSVQIALPNSVPAASVSLLRLNLRSGAHVYAIPYDPGALSAQAQTTAQRALRQAVASLEATSLSWRPCSSSLSVSYLMVVLPRCRRPPPQLPKRRPNVLKKRPLNHNPWPLTSTVCLVGMPSGAGRSSRITSSFSSTPSSTTSEKGCLGRLVNIVERRVRLKRSWSDKMTPLSLRRRPTATLSPLFASGRSRRCFFAGLCRTCSFRPRSFSRGRFAPLLRRLRYSVSRRLSPVWRKLRPPGCRDGQPLSIRSHRVSLYGRPHTCSATRGEEF